MNRLIFVLAILLSTNVYAENLNEDDIKSFYDDIELTANKTNVIRLSIFLSENFELKVHFKKTGEVRIMSKQQYLDHIDSFWKNSTNYQTTHSRFKIILSSDKKEAIVTYRAHEEFIYQGKKYKQSNSETNKLRIDPQGNIFIYEAEMSVEQ